MIREGATLLGEMFDQVVDDLTRWRAKEVYLLMSSFAPSAGDVRRSE